MPHLTVEIHFKLYLFSRTNWFGMLYSWADSKKKSNLVLSAFPCGVEIPWLGNLKRLTPAAEMDENPYKFDGQSEESPFPVETSRRRSYHSQASVVWVKSNGLQVREEYMYTAKKPLLVGPDLGQRKVE